MTVSGPSSPIILRIVRQRPRKQPLADIAARGVREYRNALEAKPVLTRKNPRCERYIMADGQIKFISSPGLTKDEASSLIAIAQPTDAPGCWWCKCVRSTPTRLLEPQAQNAQVYRERDQCNS